MKTVEELNALKEEVETLNKKLAELTDEELEQIAGGGKMCPGSGNCYNCEYIDCKYHKTVSSGD